MIKFIQLNNSLGQDQRDLKDYYLIYEYETDEFYQDEY